MTETVIDSQTVPSGGGTVTGTFSKKTQNDETILLIRGDANTTSIDVRIIAAHPESLTNSKLVSVEQSQQPNITGLDATAYPNNDIAIRLPDLRGHHNCRIEITNDATSDTTISVEQSDFGFST